MLYPWRSSKKRKSLASHILYIQSWRKLGAKWAVTCPLCQELSKCAFFPPIICRKCPFFWFFLLRFLKNFAPPVWSSFCQSWYTCMYFFRMRSPIRNALQHDVFFIFLSLKKCVLNTVPYYFKISFVRPGMHNVIFWIESPVRNVLQHGSIFSSFCRNIALLLLATVLKNYSLMVR